MGDSQFPYVLTICWSSGFCSSRGSQLCLTGGYLSQRMKSSPSKTIQTPPALPSGEYGLRVG